MLEKLRVCMTREMLTPAGEYPEHIRDLPLLQNPRVDFVPCPRVEKVLPPEVIRDFDACLVGFALVNHDTFRGVERVCCMSRWGVGYDNVDPKACTDNDVVLITTRGALDYSVAESAISYMLALSHKMLLKHRHAAANDWSQRLTTLGNEIREKTIGIVGLGAIGAALLKLLAPFQPGRILVFDPFLNDARAKELAIEKTDLATLLKESDMVSIHCPKTPETTNLIDAKHFAQMKPSAYLINTARGGIVNEQALSVALCTGQIRGAGIDVFESEPPPADHPLLKLDNVILSPHANSLTQECFRDIGLHITRNLTRLISGECPEFAINREVFDRPKFREKLARLKARMAQ